MKLTYTELFLVFIIYIILLGTGVHIIALGDIIIGALITALGILLMGIFIGCEVNK